MWNKKNTILPWFCVVLLLSLWVYEKLFVFYGYLILLLSLYFKHHSNSIHIMAGFYPSTFVYSRFFLKDWVFLLFAESVNLDLQIIEKCISDTLFGFKAYVVHRWETPFFLWILWFGDKVHKVPSLKLMHKSQQHTPKATLLVWGHPNFFFCNQTLLGLQLVMFDLKLLL